MAVENPADETQVAEVSATPLKEIERAIEEGRRSFDEGTWAARPARERADVVSAFLDSLERSREALVATLVAGVRAADHVRRDEPARHGRGPGALDDRPVPSMTHEESNPVPLDELVRGRVALSIRRHEPVGVVAAITPYNAALLMALQKLVPALMAGNSVIVRPSPLTPLSSLALGAAADEAGLPPGVLQRDRRVGLGRRRAADVDPMVDMVSFTGSTAVGKQILAQAAPTVKRVALELGGKSAQIYLPDAVERARPSARPGGRHDRRAGVRRRHADARPPRSQGRRHRGGLRQAYGGITVGPPTEPGTLMGPVISAAQRERCERYVALAEEHGGKVAVGGGRPAGLERGYYFEPTVLDLPDNSNPAAQDEIFGPVLCGHRLRGPRRRRAHRQRQRLRALPAQVYGADVAAATSVARRLRTGAVNVNTAVFSAYAPGGGYKQSGLGRERGTDGIRAFQEVKHMAIGELPR